MAKRKLISVGVLMGGPSSEHEVSLLTGQNVLENLDAQKYRAFQVKISKKGKWFLGNKISSQSIILKNCDIIFNAMHGNFGEDGKIQGILEHSEIKYTGSGIAASALGMDKIHSREIFKLAGLKTPRTMTVKKGENYSARLNFFINKVIGWPVVVKPSASGSSVGVSVANANYDLEKALKEVFKHGAVGLVEEHIKGREFTCGVIENYQDQSHFALPVTEIKPAAGNQFFNYKAKYKTGEAEESTPAQIDGGLTLRIQDAAVVAHKVLGCRSYSRTDFIVRESTGDVYVLETNTLPGLTKNSLFPKAALAAGLTLSGLLDTIIASSL